MNATTKQVLKFLVNRGYGYSNEIVNHTGLSRDQVVVALNELIRDSLIRMKEDEIDHEWEYRPTPNGKKAIEYPIDPNEVSDQMDEEVLKEGAPMVGIFWIHNGEVITPGDTSSIAVRNAPELAGHYDSPSDHITAWPLITKLYPELRGKEYDEIPRGRITMHKGSRQFTVMLPPEIADDKNIHRRIRQEFNLPKENTRFIGDDHYQSTGEIDWDDDNF